MAQPVYRRLASLIAAREYCRKTGNERWRANHEETAEALVRRNLPHGSGFDDEWHIDWENSHREKVVLYSSFHNMDEYGFYTGWIDFTVTITPSLQHEFDITVSIDGIDGEDEDDGLADYIAEVVAEALAQKAQDAIEEANMKTEASVKKTDTRQALIEQVWEAFAEVKDKGDDTAYLSFLDVFFDVGERLEVELDDCLQWQATEDIEAQLERAKKACGLS